MQVENTVSNIQQKLCEGLFRTCIRWNNHSVQCRSSQTWSWSMHENYIKDHYYAKFHTQCHREMHLCCRLSINILTELLGLEMNVKGTGSWWMLEEYVKDNYYARIHTHSYYYCSEMHFSSGPEVNFDKVIGAWKWTKAVCSKSIWRRIYFARFKTLSYYCCTEMHNNSRLDLRFWQSQWTAKCRSMVPGHCVCLKNVSRTTTMQGLIFTAITVTEKCISILDLM